MIKLVTLGEVAQVIMGSAPPGETYNEIGRGLPMIAGAGDYGDEFPEPKKWTTTPSQVAEIGDLIICVRATIGDLNWADKEYCLGRGVAGIRAKTNRLDIRYLAHYINNKKKELSRLGTGSTFPAIRRGDLESFPVPLPPIEEQKRIAAILDKADAIRRKRQEAIKLADDFVRAVFVDKFGDPAFNPKRTNVERVGQLLSRKRHGIKTGPFGTVLKKQEYISSGIPVWGIDCIKSGKFEESTSLFISSEKFEELKAYSVENGDILISRAGTVGLMCVARPSAEKSIIGTNLVRVALDTSKILPDYFVSLFNYFGHRIGNLRVNQKEKAYSFLNPAILRELSIPVPPLQAQQEYHDILNRVERLLSKESAISSLQNEICGSLTQRAFRGEL